MPASSPTVSVVLPVWNCPGYVGAAIESVLHQTFQDFEFIIIDDGSTDETPEVLKRYQDARIRHIRHENRGLAGTLNVGISLARGTYIARQDQDDLSLPERLKKQVAFMEANPECALLGTWAQIIEEDKIAERFHKHPSDPQELAFSLLLNNPFVHSSVMIRKSVVESVGGYSTDPNRQPPEDFELWSRLSRCAQVANLPEVLLHYREIPSSMSRQGPSPFRNRLITICRENIAATSRLEASDPDILAIAAITHGAPDLLAKAPDFQRVRSILDSCAESIFGEAVPSSIRSGIDNRVGSLKAGWVIQRGPLKDLVANVGPVRTFLKFVYRRLFSKA